MIGRLVSFLGLPIFRGELLNFRGVPPRPPTKPNKNLPWTFAKKKNDQIEQAFTNLLGMGVAASGYAVGKVHRWNGFAWCMASKV